MTESQEKVGCRETNSQRGGDAEEMTGHSAAIPREEARRMGSEGEKQRTFPAETYARGPAPGRMAEQI